MSSRLEREISRQRESRQPIQSLIEGRGTVSAIGQDADPSPQEGTSMWYFRHRPAQVDSVVTTYGADGPCVKPAVVLEQAEVAGLGHARNLSQSS